MSDLCLRPASEADLPFIMATERLPGYEALVGRWDEAQHRAALADSKARYWIAETAGQPIGFALLQNYGGSFRTTLIQRVALAVTDRGYGRALMRAVVDDAFTNTPVHRMVIGCFPDNLRARRCYESAGFQAEGITRGSCFFAGAYRDELMLAMLRPDWQQP